MAKLGRRRSVSRVRDGHTLWDRLSWLIEGVMLVVVLVALVLLLAVSYRRVTQEAFFPIERILLEHPLVYGDEQAILKVFRDNKVLDLTHLDAKRLAEKIQEVSWVESASVEKKWLSSIVVDVVERIPVVRWGDGSRYLDPDGVVFALPENPALRSLFKVQGPEGYEKVVLEHYRIFEPWLLSYGIAIESVTLDSRLIWHVRIGNGVDVVLGRHDLNQRLKKLVLAYERIIKSQAPYIEKVDLRYHDGFSIHWKKGVKPQLGH